MKKDKISRLKDVLEKINLYGRLEGSFNKLYDVLEKEYHLEGGRNGTGTYWNNLRQTIEKQADSYREAKSRRPKRGAPDEYASFVNNFTQDVKEELGRIGRDGDG